MDSWSTGTCASVSFQSLSELELEDDELDDDEEELLDEEEELLEDEESLLCFFFFFSTSVFSVGFAAPFSSSPTFFLSCCVLDVR